MDSDSDDDKTKNTVMSKLSPVKASTGSNGRRSSGSKKSNNSRGKGKKRDYDRHVSGTGRDKSIKKNGGGAHNWGKSTEYVLLTKYL